MLFNALRLREELEKAIHAVDPNGHDFATRHIVVLGHSMGVLMAHMLVSSSAISGSATMFAVPPLQLKGDPQTIRQIKDSLMLRRTPSVLQAIFVPTPHRGSKLAESLDRSDSLGLVRLPTTLQSAFVEFATENRRRQLPRAAAFDKGFNLATCFGSMQRRLHTPDDLSTKTVRFFVIYELSNRVSSKSCLMQVPRALDHTAYTSVLARNMIKVHDGN